MRTIGNLLLLVALGLWGGTVVFYSFLVTPTLFSALGREAGGRAVSALFPTYYLAVLGFALATAVLAALRAWAGSAPGVGWPAWTIAGLSLVAALIAAYSRWGLLPQVAQAERGTPAFDQLHLLSVALNLVVLGLFVVCAALVARFPEALLWGTPREAPIVTFERPAAR
ncbi:MAG: DUF4149 domain-containing protein [Chloroflexi bacterium]|nr:DUF4149 domain-containing protein [Chloroflexota bacterium]